jgi:hypothetical protein
MDEETLGRKLLGSENIVVLNGHVWKKHRMVSTALNIPFTADDFSTYFNKCRSQTQLSTVLCQSTCLVHYVKR